MKIRILPNTVIDRLADRSAGGMPFRLNKHVLLVKCGNSLCHFFILDVMAVFDLNRF